MKLGKVLGLSAALCLWMLPLAAQETNNVEQLKKQLQELQQKFQKQQEEQRQQIEALQKQLEALLQQHKPEQAAATNQSSATDPTAAVPSLGPPAEQPWSPSQPISLGRAGSAYMNVSFDALMDFGGSTASDPSARMGCATSVASYRGCCRRRFIPKGSSACLTVKVGLRSVFAIRSRRETTVELRLTVVFAARAICFTRRGSHRPSI